MEHLLPSSPPIKRLIAQNYTLKIVHASQSDWWHAIQTFRRMLHPSWSPPAVLRTDLASYWCGKLGPPFVWLSWNNSSQQILPRWRCIIA